MRTLIAIAVVTSVLAGALLAAAVEATASASVCHEDMPCWNWRTMGDGERGVITLAGRFKVVDAKHFDALNRAFRIDWERTWWLRGDGKRFNVQLY